MDKQGQACSNANGKKTGACFPAKWEHSTHTPCPGKINSPTMMQWQHVATAPKHLLKCWSQWKQVAILIQNESKSNTHKGDVSRKLLAMFSEPKHKANQECCPPGQNTMRKQMSGFFNEAKSLFSKHFDCWHTALCWENV